MPESWESVQAGASVGVGPRFATQEYTISAQVVEFPVSIIGLFVDETTAPLAARADQQLAANSLSVVLAIDQTRTVSGTNSVNVAVVDAFGDQVTHFRNDGSLLDGTWQYANQTVAPPGAGDIRLNAGTPNLTTIIWLHKLDDLGVHHGPEMWSASAPFALFLRKDNDKTARFIVNSITDSGDYLTLVVTFDGTTTPTPSPGPSRVTWQSNSFHVSITDVVSVDDNGGSLTVDGTVAISGTVTVATHAVTQSGTWNIGTVATITNVVHVDDNGGSITIDGSVGITGTVAATQSGTWNIATVSTVTACSTVTTLIGGSIAHDSPDSQSPHKIGARATTALSGLTLVANADRTDLLAGIDGVLITRPHCNLEDVVQDRATDTAGTSTAFAGGLAAPGAGIRLWITGITIANSSATFCTVDLRDGAAGAVLWTLPVPATGGVTHKFDPPLRLTANTALAFDASAATTTLSISGNGFRSKV